MMLAQLRAYLLTLAILTVVTLVGKGQFAITHSDLHQGQGLTELLVTLFWGIRFDLAIAATFALLSYILTQLLSTFTTRDISAIAPWIMAFSAAALLVLHGADTLYYHEAGRHLGYEFKEGIRSGSELISFALGKDTQVVITQLVLIAIVTYTIFWLSRRHLQPIVNTVSVRQRLVSWGALLPILLLSVLLVRGGTQSVPLEPLHAQRIGSSQRATLALNGAYNALYATLSGKDVSSQFAEPPSERQTNLVRRMYSSTLEKVNGNKRAANIIFILLESWSGSHMASYGAKDIITPNFDHMRQQGLTTRAMLAGGSRTTEGMFSTFCSAQNPLGQTVAQSQLQNYDYHCLPELLKQEGWHSAFFQGTNKETSGTGSFAQLLGFEESFGKSDMQENNNQYPQNSWGYHDPDLYRFTLEKIRHMPQPFLVAINTNSTHDRELPEGVSPLLPPDNKLNGYKNVLNFSDKALFEFIEEVKNSPVFAETVFVLVADHSGPTPPTPLQKHLIPFAIVAPWITPQNLDIVASQRDIAPTVLQLINLAIPEHFTGISLLQQDVAARFADYYHQGILGWVEGGKAIEFPLKAPEQKTCLNLSSSIGYEHRIECDRHLQEMQERALAFTSTSQSLLFSGRLNRFAQMKQHTLQ